MDSPTKAIISAGTTCGVMDITAAFLVYGTMGAKPLRILQGIAGGILGPDAYKGGIPAAVFGRALRHSCLFSDAAGGDPLISSCSESLLREIHDYRSDHTHFLCRLADRTVGAEVFTVKAFARFLFGVSAKSVRAAGPRIHQARQKEVKELF